MPHLPKDRPKIAVLTGAGISAASGLATFRDPHGIWAQYRIEDVATPEAWERDPGRVLEFYNLRRSQAAAAQPNAAHRALADLERKFDVVVITQNVDDLHERGGSTRVIHVHGELAKARSTVDPDHVRHIGAAPIRPGDCCPRGGQLRPHIVWFGEDVMHLDLAAQEVSTADKVLVVGTSLSVFPAARLVRHARYHAENILIDPNPASPPRNFTVLRGPADVLLPPLASQWLA